MHASDGVRAAGCGVQASAPVEEAAGSVDGLPRRASRARRRSTGGNYFNITARRLFAGGFFEDLGATLRGIHAKWQTVVLVDWLVWPPYFVVAFAFVPEALRPAATCADINR